MITGDQTAVIAFLGAPSTYGVPAVERIDTHTAIVFLAGSHAYKLKRAVLYDYVDFSTAERRHAMCDAEVRLNRRTAPALYLGVLAVTREPDGSLALAGTGTPVDWVVEMNRFPQEALFDRLASAGQLELELMPPLAAAIARFHAAAERRADHGGAAGMTWVVDGNAAGFAEYGTALDRAASMRVTDDSRAEIRRRTALLEARRTAGYVRQCHGDLHLRNIVLLDGQPTLFDGVEFDDEISCTDVLYDLAFLLMDLRRRRLPRHANAVWNRYLAETGDLDGLPLMPLFLSCRAAVRAKTSVTSARFQSEPSRRSELENLAREYLAMAEHLLHPSGSCVVAVGGLSGTGKSTLALALAPSIGAVPGAVVHRSDELRKGLLGVPPLERLHPEAYSPQISERVYYALAERARLTVNGGYAAIADAVFARPEDRQAIERVAAEASVPFVGVWLEAPEATLIARTEQRRHDPSDADAAVVRMQGARDTGPISWHRLDASLEPHLVLQNATAHMRQRLAVTK